MNKYFISALIILFLIYSVFVEPNMLVVKRYEIEDEALSGIKIVFVSDFHVKKYQKGRLKRTVELINKQNADIVLSAGDYVSGHKIKSTLNIEELFKELSKIKSKYGYYTVLGNHDGWIGENIISKELEKYSVKVLKNENTALNIEGRTIYIAGIEDLITGNPSVVKALNGVKAPVILLTHHPDMFTLVPYGVNLTLAGHTHGGQIRLPFIGALIVPSQFGNKYAMGLIEEKSDNKTKKMIVTKGIGTSIIPVRFNCIPEIVVIEFI